MSARIKANEIFPLIILTFFLIAAQIRLSFSSSKKILKYLQNLQAHAARTFLLRPLIGFKTTRLLSLLEAVDRNLLWKPSCLRRTLALAWLARGLGFAPELKIGAQRQEGALSAHAWLELDGMRLEMQNDGVAYSVLSQIPED